MKIDTNVATVAVMEYNVLHIYFLLRMVLIEL
jgi:hypothetical protein